MNEIAKKQPVTRAQISEYLMDEKEEFPYELTGFAAADAVASLIEMYLTVPRSDLHLLPGMIEADIDSVIVLLREWASRATKSPTTTLAPFRQE